MLKILIIEKNKHIVNELITLIQKFSETNTILHSDNIFAYENETDIDFVFVNAVDYRDSLDSLELRFNVANIGMIIDEKTKQLNQILKERDSIFFFYPFDEKHFANVFLSKIKMINTIRYQEHQLQDMDEKLRKAYIRIEHELMDNIIHNAPTEDIQKDLKLLNIKFHEGTVLVTDQKLSSISKKKIVDILKKFNFHIIERDYRQYSVYLFMNQATLTFQMAKKIMREFEKLNSNKKIVGIGFLKHKASQLYQSYAEAIDDLLDIEGITDYGDQYFMNKKRLGLDIFLYYLMNDEEMLDKAIAYYVNAAINADMLLEEIVSVFSKNLNQYIIRSFRQPAVFQKHISVTDSQLMIKYLYHELMKENLQLIKIRADKPHIALRRILIYIYHNYSNPTLNLELTSKQLSMSTYYICHLIKDHLDITFTDCVNYFRIEKAKRYLYHDNVIKRIAFECGYSNITYFCRVFKNYTGMTPSQYKDSIHAHTT